MDKTCKRCGGSGRTTIPLSKRTSNMPTSEPCAVCKGSGSALDLSPWEQFTDVTRVTFTMLDGRMLDGFAYSVLWEGVVVFVFTSTNDKKGFYGSRWYIPLSAVQSVFVLDDGKA